MKPIRHPNKAEVFSQSFKHNVKVSTRATETNVSHEVPNP